MIRRRYLAVLTVAGLASCQQVLGISPGTLISGSGGSGGASGSSSSSGLGAGPAGSSTSSAGGGGGAFTTSASSSSSGAGTSTTASSSSTSTGTTTGSSSSSSSGTVSCTTTPAIVDVIDDMNSGQGHILVRNGRQGPWFTANDSQTTDMQVPVPGMVCNPVASTSTCFTWAMNTTGTLGATNSYAQIGFDLDQAGGVTKPYDAGNDAGTYNGIIFWAQGMAGLKLHAQFLIPATVFDMPASGGGTCSSMCGDSYELVKPLTTAWKAYTVPFGSLGQEGFGAAGVPFTPNAILTIQFQVKSEDGTTAFDYTIGPVGFY